MAEASSSSSSSSLPWGDQASEAAFFLRAAQGKLSLEGEKAMQAMLAGLVNSKTGGKGASAGCEHGCGSKEYFCTSCGSTEEPETCSECGFMACESCRVHYTRGTCYCPTGNFGTPYCKMEPAYYHVEGGTGVKYRGDRHPISACDERFGTVFDPEVFEENEREYKNCGKAVLCFHKKYC